MNKKLEPKLPKLSSENENLGEDEGKVDVWGSGVGVKNQILYLARNIPNGDITSL